MLDTSQDDQDSQGGASWSSVRIKHRSSRCCRDLQTVLIKGIDAVSDAGRPVLHAVRGRESTLLFLPTMRIIK